MCHNLVVRVGSRVLCYADHAGEHLRQSHQVSPHFEMASNKLVSKIRTLVEISTFGFGVHLRCGL
jgi:hypothetical protein